MWNDQATPEATFGYVKSLGELQARLDETERELGSRVIKAITSVENGGAVGRRRSGKDKAMLIVVAVKRPMELQSGLRGLSEDPRARTYELAGYLITAGTDRNLYHLDNRVTPVTMLLEPTTSLFRYMTGTPALQGTAVVGAGALGCTVIEYLLRAGLDEMLVIDHDQIAPHNLARHGARGSDTFGNKADWARRLSQQIRMPPAGEAEGGVCEKVRAEPRNVLSFSGDDLQQILGSTSVVVDLTANAKVRSHLCREAGSRRLVRGEAFDRGRLGTLCVGAADSNPDPFDLYHVLCSIADQDEGVDAWLAGERGGRLGLQEMATGFGCASATVQLPKWAIDQHAAAFMPSLIDALRVTGAAAGAGIGTNRLDGQFRPQGWRWHDVPAFLELRDEQWCIRIHPSVAEELRGRRAEALPSETGGYLFGGWDRSLKRITVVAATPAPPGTRGSPVELDLAAVSRCPIASRLRRRSTGRLALVGTWHSHPDHHRMPSGKDLFTMSKIAAQNKIGS